MIKLHIKQTKKGVLIPLNEFRQIVSLAQKLENIQLEEDNFRYLLEASASNLDFWDNEIDDKVWNDA